MSVQLSRAGVPAGAEGGAGGRAGEEVRGVAGTGNGEYERRLAHHAASDASRAAAATGKASGRPPPVAGNAGAAGQGAGKCGSLAGLQGAVILDGQDGCIAMTQHQVPCRPAFLCLV